MEREHRKRDWFGIGSTREVSIQPSCNVIFVSADLNLLINMLLFPTGHVNQVS